MAQAGLHIPASPDSEVAVFPEVYADIGDEQSIEQSLSTFSSHLTAIVEILRSLRVTPAGDARALVLLDEVGAGTDPTEGAALAQAVIEALHEQGVCTVVTTHFNELKTFAFTHSGVENASVEFDENTLRPTFRVLIGTPGHSNAFVIAERLGLDPEIVSRARSYLARRDADLAGLLEAIDRDRAALAAERGALARTEADLARMRERQEEETRRLVAERQRLADRAHAELSGLLRTARKDLEELMAVLRSEPTPQAVARVRGYLQDLSQTADAYAAEADTPPPGSPPEGLRVGEDVLVVSLDRRGVVRAGPDNRGEVEVQTGPLKVRVALSDLRRVAASGSPAPLGTPAAAVSLDKSLTVSSTLDLRGREASDAVLELDKYLDEATLAGLERVTIIHGKGTGALRRAVQAHLTHHPEVAAFRLGGGGEGGSGATIVDLARP
jgi:DNA mismatch repair protein MutS2